MRTMDLIEPAFRPLYEKICVGNKGEQNQNIFFEGMLLEEGLGTCNNFSSYERRCGADLE